MSKEKFERTKPHVNVVLPWSTCPIVPTFTWGFVRSNLPLAILFPRSRYVCHQLVPMAWIEHATSPLPRECSTTELHGRMLSNYTRHS